MLEVSMLYILFNRKIYTLPFTWITCLIQQQKIHNSNSHFTLYWIIIQVNLDMTDSMGPGKLVRHMQNPSYTYDEYLICIGLGPSILSVIFKNLSNSGPSYPSSPVLIRCEILYFITKNFNPLCDFSNEKFDQIHCLLRREFTFCSLFQSTAQCCPRLHLNYQAAMVAARSSKCTRYEPLTSPWR